MTTRSPPLFKKLFAGMTSSCKQQLQRFQNTLRGFFTQSEPPVSHTKEWPPLDKLALTPLDEIHPACTRSSLEEELNMEQKTLTVTQWTLDDNLGSEKNKKVTVVEVEFFPTDPYMASTKHPKRSTLMNYTKEGEDPNLRITHYPPSNRLH